MSEFSTLKLEALLSCEGYVFEMDSVLEMLEQVVDSRHARGKVYALCTILLLMLLAKLSGEDSERGMAQWLAERKTALADLPGLEKVRTPCRTTLRRIVTWIVSVEQLEKLFGAFLQRLAVHGL